MAAPPLILFDLDDTLCDYSGARIGRLRGAFTLALDRSGITGVDLEALIAESISIHPHGSEHFPALLAREGVVNPEIALEARRWYHQNRFLGLRLFPGAMEALRAVRALPGVQRIGIVTNGPAEVQCDKIELLDLRSAIDFAVISGEIGVEKPDPGIFAEALRLGNQPADQTIYVGDSPEFDMDGAFNSGIERIWVNPHALGWQGTTPQPTHQVRSVSAIPELLAG